MWQDTQRPRHAEEDGVVVLLGQAIVLQEYTGVRVDVGVRVFRLAMLCENTGGNLVDLGDKLEHRIIWQMLLRELALRDVARVGLAQDGVAIAGNDLASLERAPEVVLDGLVGQIIADRLLHLLQPVEDFLVGEAVQRTSKTVETSSEGEHRRAESAAHQVSGVSGDVTTFVVRVDGEVEAHQLDKVAILRKAKLIGQVVPVVLVLCDRRNLAVLIDVPVNLGRNRGELGYQVHAVLECVLPVLRLGHALSVILCECRLVLQSSDGDAELSHWVHVARAAIDELFDVFRNLRARSPIGG